MPQFKITYYIGSGEVNENYEAEDEEAALTHANTLVQGQDGVETFEVRNGAKRTIVFKPSVTHFSLEPAAQNRSYKPL